MRGNEDVIADDLQVGRPAQVALRVREPSLPRPYKVPGGLLGSILIGVGPIAIMCVAFYKLLSEKGAQNALIVSAGSVVAGVILYFIAIGISPKARGKADETRGFEVVTRDS